MLQSETVGAAVLSILGPRLVMLAPSLCKRPACSSAAYSAHLLTRPPWLDHMVAAWTWAQQPAVALVVSLVAVWALALVVQQVVVNVMKVVAAVWLAMLRQRLLASAAVFGEVFLAPVETTVETALPSLKLAPKVEVYVEMTVVVLVMVAQRRFPVAAGSAAPQDARGYRDNACTAVAMRSE